MYIYAMIITIILIGEILFLVLTKLSAKIHPNPLNPWQVDELNRKEIQCYKEDGLQ
jgi:hypothetical protein